MRKTKLLLLVHEMSLTGAPLLILDAFEATSKDMEIRVIALHGGPLAPRFRNLGQTTVLMDVSSASSALQKAIALIRFLLLKGWWSLVLGRWAPDIVYVNSASALRIPRVLRLPAAPVLLHVHEMAAALRAAIRLSSRRLLCEWPQRYIAVSEAVKQALVEEYRIPENKVTMVHSFINKDYFGSDAVPTSRSDGPLYIGASGQVSWTKGPLLWLLMAVELIKILGAEAVRFAWVGVSESQESIEFREMAIRLGIDSHIDFIPVTADPYAHFRQFDVFTLTSMEEALGRVVLESMMMGKPVVCFSGSGGPVEALGDTGLVIQGFSPILMAEAIADLVKSPDRMKAMGEAARKRVIECFVVSVQAPKIRAEIDRVVSESREKATQGR